MKKQERDSLSCFFRKNAAAFAPAFAPAKNKSKRNQEKVKRTACNDKVNMV